MWCTTDANHHMTGAGGDCACPTCGVSLCTDCARPGALAIDHMDAEALGDPYSNTCKGCGAHGCSACMTACNAGGCTPVQTEEPCMLCPPCAERAGVRRVGCTEHPWFAQCSDVPLPEHDGACQICRANANYCAKMESAEVDTAEDLVSAAKRRMTGKTHPGGWSRVVVTEVHPPMAVRERVTSADQL